MSVSLVNECNKCRGSEHERSRQGGVALFVDCMVVPVCRIENVTKAGDKSCGVLVAAMAHGPAADQAWTMAGMRLV